MDTTVLGLVSSYGAAIIGGVIWAVRQEGRLDNHDRLFEERKIVADERHDDLKERLERIEQKLDRMNSHSSYDRSR